MSSQSILGAYAIDGNPDVVADAANRLRAAETRARAVREKLDGSHLRQVWSGGASQAFQAIVQDLPGELTKVVSSCSVARTSLETYAGRMRETKARGDTLASEAEQADRTVGVAHQRVGVAQAAVRRSRAQVAAAATPEERLQMQRQLTHNQTLLVEATRHRDAAQGSAASVRTRACSNRQAFEEAATHCVDGLNTASDLGMKSDLFTSYERHVAPLAVGALQVATTVGKGFVAAVELVVDFVTDTIVDASILWWNLAALVMHPTSANFDRLMDSVDAVLVIAGIVLLIAGVAISAPVSLAVVGAGLIAGAVRLAVHAIQASSGDRDPDAVAWDLLGVALSVSRAPGAKALVKKVSRQDGVRDLVFDQSESLVQSQAEKQFVSDPTDESALWKMPFTDVFEDTRDQIVDSRKDAMRIILTPTPVPLWKLQLAAGEQVLEQQTPRLDPRVIEGSAR